MELILIYPCPRNSRILSRNVKAQDLFRQARFACLCCAVGEHFVSAGGALWAPGVTLVNYKGYNISKYICPTVTIDMGMSNFRDGIPSRKLGMPEIARKITKFVNLFCF